MRAPLVAFARVLSLATVVGGLAGAASALFLALLDLATKSREAHPGLVVALPFAGLCMGFVYDKVGKSVRGGTDVVLDAVHDETKHVPLRMGPLVLVGTLLTHLFGGSAGREGTAVQMGASLSAMVGRVFRVDAETRRKLLVAGIAGGFGSVFGTPLAGAVFALEVPTVGAVTTDAIVPAVVASVVGDLAARALSATHTTYPSPPWLSLTPLVLAKLVALGLGCAAVSASYTELTKAIRRLAESKKVSLPVRMMLGGATVAALSRVFRSTDSLGLGVPTIVRAFRDPSLPAYTFAVKLVLTAITLGAGFMGGEVTPLFFIGATFGSVFAKVVGLPLALGAACGMAAVFAASANTPLALTLMAVELVGTNVLPHALVVVVVAFLASGHRGIYGAQRVAVKKDGTRLSPAIALRDLEPDRGPSD